MYCRHCMRQIDGPASFCPACGKPIQDNGSKRTWHFYVGIFCAVGAVVMLSKDIAVSAGYAVIALLLLWKSHRIKKASQKDSNNYNYGHARRLELNNYTIKQTKLPKSDEPHTAGPGPIYAQGKTSSDIPSNKKTVFDGKDADAIVQALHEETLAELSRERAARKFAEQAASVRLASSTMAVSELDTKTFTTKVTGMQYHMDALLELASENPDYHMSKKEIIDNFMTDEKIYEYEFFAGKTKLIPEPDNPYDSNAVKVVIDGNHVGYIKAGSCARILKLLREDRIQRIEAEVGGGKYKLVYEEDDEETYTLERGQTHYYVHLTIYEVISA